MFTQLKNQLLVCCVFLSLCAFSAQEQFKDIDIENAVNEELLIDEAVKNHMIDTSVSEGIVTLKGSVGNLLAKNRATELASTIRGVRSIVNQLSVIPVMIPDDDLKNNIEEALRDDPATDSWEINSTVSGGTVVLTGIVESFAEKNLTETVAASVSGVKAIENNITVADTGERLDSEIKKDIIGKIKNDVHSDVYNLDVTVNNGNVTLKGVTGSSFEKSRATADAFMIRGVKSVEDSGLKIEWWAENDMERASTPLPGDKEITDAIRDALLYDPRVLSTNVTVSCKNGSATLNGTVDNLRAKRSAEQDALNTAGVWQVKNYLLVHSKTLKPNSLLKADAQEKIFRDPYLSRHDIEVSVINNRLYLYGNVDDNFEKQHAETILSSIPGVAEISNYLTTMKPYRVKTDWEIMSDVKNQLFWDSRVSSGGVNVEVNNGHVTLTGTVPTWSARMAASTNAFEGGATTVTNQLKLNSAPDFFTDITGIP